MRQEQPGVDYKVMNNMIMESWKTLTPEQKLQYSNQQNVTQANPETPLLANNNVKSLTQKRAVAEFDANTNNEQQTASQKKVKHPDFD